MRFEGQRGRAAEGKRRREEQSVRGQKQSRVGWLAKGPQEGVGQKQDGCGWTGRQAGKEGRDEPPPIWLIR
ncbi:hypothetical protein Pmani_029665 [Petrolisthes manimaculis]|uniref:Uncharacterized protein n=1 Tax=Petrolisthes manimaculis TaxID=1843537 RepID=A0AAE1NX75_9EUCA|nr:hypothetical protein Pmani_029665 [Petrolisthes manimaculis]